jgi:hypothetical protein
MCPHRKDSDHAETKLMGKAPIGKGIPGITATVLSNMQQGWKKPSPGAKHPRLFQLSNLAFNTAKNQRGQGQKADL